MGRKPLPADEKTKRSKRRLALAGQRSVDAIAKTNEIGDIPPPANQSRRDSCRTDLHSFLTTYFTTDGPMRPFSPDHRRAIQRFQNIIESGGRMALSVFRGWAKTWIFERAALWAALYGYRSYIVIYAATKPLAKESLDGSIKGELYDNDMLAADFPEVCIPFRRIEQKAQRANQTQYGEPTGCRWLGDRVICGKVLTSMGEWSAVSETIIVVRGITGGTRGLKKGNIRPDCVFVDDPQTDKSATSSVGIESRLNIITAGLLSLAGHFGRPLAIAVIGSVIASNDLMERLLGMSQWQGERIKMLVQPANAHDTLWLGQYAAILVGYDRSDPSAPEKAQAEATSFYIEHQEEMDAGCIVSWDGCFGESEASAIQHAYNKLIELGKWAFAAEMQSEPLKAEETGLMCLAAEIARKVSAWGVGVVPPAATVITAYLDVQGVFLPYAVAAWEPGFNGQFIEYGAFPRQSRQYYTLDTAFPSMEDHLSQLRPELKGQGLDVIVAAGLDYAIAELLGKRWKKPDGQELSIDQLLIDTGWRGHLVYGAIQRLRQPGQTLSRVMPAKGFGTTATKAFLAFSRKDGDVWGTGWGAKHPKPGELRLVNIDTNHGKTFLHERIMTPIGGRGCLSLYHEAPAAHSLIADAWTCESPQRVQNKSNDRELTVWVEGPGLNNHLFDCAVGCVAGASMRGIQLVDVEPQYGRKARARRPIGDMIGV
jgi:hypothetical protein